jgi:BASS family bile acid:Na+ symporter
MRLNDILLFIVVFASMAVAVLYPQTGVMFQDYLLYLMMVLLFLSFLKIDFKALVERSVPEVARLSLLVVVKLIVLPGLMYAIAQATMPEYAVPVLLISGISTGVVAPFMATLLSADVVVVLRMVIVTSVLVPFTLPTMVKILAGAHMEIPVEMMVRMLGLVIFVPMGAVLVFKRLFPGLPDRIAERQFPIALVLFAVINLGVFSKYSHFFFQNPGKLITSVIVAFVASVAYYVFGFAFGSVFPRHRNVRDQVAAAVSFAIINNVLVIVFASRFFGPLAPTVAAMYMFPYYALIVPARLIVNRLEAQDADDEGAP